MELLKGKYSEAIIYTNNIEESAKEQILELCNQDFTKNSKIRIMPDCHSGKGCVIGFTANLGDKVIPNIVGVDLGCGMLTIELNNFNIDLKKIDEIINQYIPSGFNTHQRIKVRFPKLKNLYCYRNLKNTKRIEKSIGTLGGGNHFIEIDKDDDNKLYLVIHSGSRNLGKQVAEYYQNIAIDICNGKEDYCEEKKKIIKECTLNGEKFLIQDKLNELKNKYEKSELKLKKELCFLTGDFKDAYLHDMKICQEYAILNRKVIANIILDKMFNKKLDNFKYFETVHNYINFKDNIIRKGSISVYKNEKVLIPINMRDGSIIALGKGNSNWNYSAPHGAGRIMSRNKAKKLITMKEYKDSMKNIFSTSITKNTLDEAPMSYKPIKEIIENIKDTVDIVKIIKPIYNFKAK